MAMSPDEFRTLGHEVIDRLAGAMAAIPAGPVTPDEAPAAIRAALDLEAPLPEGGTDPGSLLRDTVAQLFAHSLFNAHPRYWGYITSAPAPIGVLADLIAAALNANVGAWRLSPAATEIERQAVRWIAEFIGYPADGGGLLVSGGNMANIVGLLAARAARAPWDVRADGMRAPRGHMPRLYCSRETHTWIQKAADLAGFGTSAIRWLPVDREGRMDVNVLRVALASDRAAGDIPIAVVGTAGSVSTGAIDPLIEIASICRDHDVWFHVDGAYGGFAAALPDAPGDLRGLALADSVAVDPHKWLYAPLEVGCTLVRDADHLRAAFAYHPPYYHFDEEATNYLDYGPQNSRGFRALKVWLSLRHAGAAGHRQAIADDITLAGALADFVRHHPDFELLTHSLSIVTFRYVPADLALMPGPETDELLDQINRALLDRLQRGGEVFVSNAIVDGHYALRACIVNFHTDVGDLVALLEVAAREGRLADEALHPVEPIS
jgi:glutamate/tyrosine decarboxylase-like PLP-dependent enzyme